MGGESGKGEGGIRKITSESKAYMRDEKEMKGDALPENDVGQRCNWTQYVKFGLSVNSCADVEWK